MTDAILIILGAGAIVGIQLLVLSLAQSGANREQRGLQLQILDAWRQSMEKLDRAQQRSQAQSRKLQSISMRFHAENMAFHRDASVALRALLERTDRS